MALLQGQLAINVKRIVLGEIETNADEVLAFIDERAGDYAVDKFVGDADAAKKARAELNKGDDGMKNMIADLTAQWMAPIQPTIDKLTAGRKKIKALSLSCDGIVKAKEAAEDEKKRNQITEYWNTRNFDLVPLERIWDPRWLNKGDDGMKNMIADLTAQWMAPIQPTIDKLTAGRKKIKALSLSCDGIVKAKEAEEDEKKRNQITEYWNTRNFDLVPLERIWDPRWLNKGASLPKEVYPSIDAKINEIYESVKTIEDVGGEDVDVMKSEYFRNLDLAQAIRRGKQLKDDRERIAREKATRAEREQKAALDAQSTELAKEAIAEQNAEPVRSVAAAALGIAPIDPSQETVTYVMEFTGTRAAMLKLREFMTANRIVFKKIEATA